jgi:hypothetical protein
MSGIEADLTRFQREAENFARRWLGASVDIVIERRYNFLRIRIQISSESFIALYHNAQNGRGSYTLIRNERRVFGYDGVTDWHCHPIKNPEEHIPCVKPRLRQVLREMKQIVSQWSKE